ncbi:MAG TPA: cupin domain-containing protein [Thermomicrobiales bacterium]|nr:cupin domain-containing protein [Thermomicrobiales bacterium]
MTRNPSATSIIHADAPIMLSPSGLPTRCVVSPTTGARQLFVAEQALEPGQAVPLHTHPVEEVLTFLGGSGEATCGEDLHEVREGVSVFIPPGVAHGFRNTGEMPLRVLVIFPGDSFAETIGAGSAEHGREGSRRMRSRADDEELTSVG